MRYNPTVCIMAVSVITASCQGSEHSQSNAMNVEVAASAAAIERVAGLTKTRECIFVVDDRFFAEIEKLKNPATRIMARSKLPSFPVQKSSDKGVLYYDVTVRDVSVDGSKAEASVRFYIGVENSAIWQVNLSRKGDGWRSDSMRIVARS